MSMTDLGIAAIYVVFTAALLVAIACLGYLVYVTVRERGAGTAAERRGVRTVAERRRAAAPSPSRGTAGSTRVVALPGLRPSIARHHHAASS